MLVVPLLHLYPAQPNRRSVGRSGRRWGPNGGRDYPYERIRKLLVRAAIEGHTSREEANRLHDEMRTLGFWDSGQPFS